MAACGLSAGTKGRLSHWAVELAFRFVGGPASATVLTCFEETLEVAKQASGQAISAGKLQAELRQLGRPDLARRVCKQAKARQGTAHPDVCLAKEVSAALLATREGPNTAPGDEGAYSGGDKVRCSGSAQDSVMDQQDGAHGDTLDSARVEHTTQQGAALGACLRSTVPPCAGPPAHGGPEDLRDRILGIFRQHDPTKLAHGEVERMLAMHDGLESQLYIKVRNQYIPGLPQRARHVVRESERDAALAAVSNLADASPVNNNTIDEGVLQSAQLVIDQLSIKYGLSKDDLASEARNGGQSEARPSVRPPFQPAVHAHAAEEAPAGSRGHAGRSDSARVRNVGESVANVWQTAGLRRQQRRQRQMV